MTETPLTKRQSYWLNHYLRCKEQKLSFEEYCRQNNLSPGAFGHARGKLAKIGALGLGKCDKPKKKLWLCRCQTSPGAHLRSACTNHFAWSDQN